MPVKILKGPPEFTVTQDCPGCKASLEATAVDMKIVSFWPNWGGETPDKDLYFSCPVCDYDVRVKGYPHSLMTRIEKRDQK